MFKPFNENVCFYPTRRVAWRDGRWRNIYKKLLFVFFRWKSQEAAQSHLLHLYREWWQRGNFWKRERKKLNWWTQFVCFLLNLSHEELWTINFFVYIINPLRKIVVFFSKLYLTSQKRSSSSLLNSLGPVKVVPIGLWTESLGFLFIKAKNPSLPVVSFFNGRNLLLRTTTWLVELQTSLCEHIEHGFHFY